MARVKVNRRTSHCSLNKMQVFAKKFRKHVLPSVGMITVVIGWAGLILSSYTNAGIERALDGATTMSIQEVCKRTKMEKGPTISNSELQPGVLPPIHQRTIHNIAPNYDGLWDDSCVHSEFQNALEKIKRAKIIHEPFDHISVTKLFSDEFYQALMNELPPHSAYTEQTYAGTDPNYSPIHLSDDLKQHTRKLVIPDDCGRDKKAGCWIENVQLHSQNAKRGKILTVDSNATRYPLWTQALRLVHSRNFTGLLFDKFATNSGISSYKMDALKKEAKGDDMSTHLRNSAALRIEPTSYHLTPHIDMFQKVITWQYFHPENTDLENRMAGTRFYNLKPAFRDVVEMSDKKNPKWLDYSHFEVVREHKVVPNYFFAFAPNNRSWHGASIDPLQMEGVNHHARRTFLGFVTTKNWGFHHFNKGDWAPRDYFYTANV